MFLYEYLIFAEKNHFVVFNPLHSVDKNRTSKILCYKVGNVL